MSNKRPSSIVKKVCDRTERSLYLVAIFYDSDNVNLAKRIGQILTDLGITPWLADLDSKLNWEQELQEKTSSKDCVGALAIWTPKSIENQIVKDEAWQFMDLKKVLLNVQFDTVRHPPCGLGGCPKISVDPANEEQALSSIKEKACQVFLPFADRQRGLELNGKFLSAPSLVLSVSSFETQIEPEDSLELLKIVRPSAFLVSAYDLLRPTKTQTKKPSIWKTEAIEELRKSGSIAVLDSGNYEAMRFRDHDWKKSKRRLSQALERIEVDLAFTHDRFPAIVNSVKELHVSQRIEEVVHEYERDKERAGCAISPIIHAPRLPNNRYGHQYLPEICLGVAQATHAKVIAVAERELGEGIYQRAKTIAEIRDVLGADEDSPLLHVLGTGNPISAAILSYAGADFFDGLEWCRTAIDGDSWRLHHFQQWDFFSTQTGSIQSDIIARLINSPEHRLPWFMRVALHNIAFFEQASMEINKHHNSDGYEDLFGTRLNMRNEFHRLKEHLEGS